MASIAREGLANCCRQPAIEDATQAPASTGRRHTEVCRRIRVWSWIIRERALPSFAINAALELSSSKFILHQQQWITFHFINHLLWLDGTISGLLRKQEWGNERHLDSVVVRRR